MIFFNHGTSFISNPHREESASGRSYASGRVKIKIIDGKKFGGIGSAFYGVVTVHLEKFVKIEGHGVESARQVILTAGETHLVAHI